MRTLSVTVTVSLLVTGDLSTSIDTVSTGGLAALGVQFRVKGALTINSVNWTGSVLAYSGGSGRGEQNKCISHMQLRISAKQLGGSGRLETGKSNSHSPRITLKYTYL